MTPAPVTVTAAEAARSRLVFYPRSHRYKLDGDWVPGVTTLIGDGLPKKALMYWSARTVAEYVANNADGVEQLRQLGVGPMVAALKEIPWQKRDDAADRGTVVHTIAERVTRGETVEVDDLHAGYVEAAVAFLDDFGVTPRVVERPHFHVEHRWAGTPDLIGDVAALDGDLAVIDWKTADSGVWPEVCLQLAPYANATHYQDEHGVDQPGLHPTRGIAVHLRTDGYTAYEVPVTDYVYSRFRHVALVAALGQVFKDDRDAWMREITPTLREVTAS